MIILDQLQTPGVYFPSPDFLILEKSKEAVLELLKLISSTLHTFLQKEMVIFSKKALVKPMEKPLGIAAVLVSSLLLHIATRGGSGS